MYALLFKCMYVSEAMHDHSTELSQWNPSDPFSFMCVVIIAQARWLDQCSMRAAQNV